MSDKRQRGLFGDDEPPESGPPGSSREKRSKTGPRPVASAPVREDDAATAAALPDTVRLGTSSWSFPGWKGIVWRDAVSDRKLSRDGLAAYARHPLLRCVGLDRTHYAPMAVDQYRAYAAQVPESFRFLVKAHEATTIRRWPDHPRYGARRGEPNPFFLDPAYATDEVIAPTVEGLSDRLGTLLFQIAPQSLKGVGGAPGFIDKLHRFLLALPKGPTYAVEVRNRALLTGAYADALRDVGAQHCLSVHPRLPPPDEQAHAAGIDAQSALLIRWMLRDGLDYDAAVERYAPFDKLVDEDEPTRRSLADLAVRAHRASRPVTIVVNNKAEGSSPLSVFRLAREIADGLAQRRDDSIV